MSASTSSHQMSFGPTLPGAPESPTHHRPKRLWMALRLLAAASVTMAVSACAGRSDLGFATLMSEVPVTRAVIVPPPGGPFVVAVLQRDYQDGLSQEIALSTASLTTGQNAFYVTLYNNTANNPEIPSSLSYPALVPDKIQQEMEERLPGVDMRTSLVYVQNKFGPFGFATGRSATGDTCLYAWQQIEPSAPAILVPGGVISVRLRLCDADASVDQLLRVFYGYTISAYYRQESWNPYGEPASPPPGFGQIDTPMYPLNLGGPNAAEVRRRTLYREPRRSLPAPEVQRRVIDKDTVMPTTAPSPSAPSAAGSTGYPIVPPPPRE
ncbi:hypothetical protein GGR34_000156 [Microvirga flocculans]|uniref:Cellulose biosynthesis protein BcsN n=1 Tax=Microvirga flocculans TaxID=217168 RepID=A0A7W6IBS9_9HYPH|nr:cellulose biosynthesis protein BcsN [Microvirga flocculans]MBB4038527.1 hypothetical protein [Microvirga flocculans]